MEERRRILGRRIKRARQRAGYKSQKAFAQAIGIDESGVAHAETGNERVAAGGKIFGAIEDGLSWPEDSIARYLETGDEALLAPSVKPELPPLTPEQRKLQEIYFEWRKRMPREDAMRLLYATIERYNAELDAEQNTHPESQAAGTGDADGRVD